MKTKISKSLSFLFLTIIIVSGCGEDGINLPVQDSYWTQNEETYIIPFEIVDNKIIMDAEINNVVGKIYYEPSREGIELTTYFFNKLSETNKKIRISSEHNIIPNIDYHFQFGGFSIDLTSADHVITRNPQMISSDQQVLALIGRGFFKNYNLSIDYVTNAIILSTGSDDSPDSPFK